MPPVPPNGLTSCFESEVHIPEFRIFSTHAHGMRCVARKETMSRLCLRTRVQKQGLDRQFSAEFNGHARVGHSAGPVVIFVKLSGNPVLRSQDTKSPYLCHLTRVISHHVWYSLPRKRQLPDSIDRAAPYGVDQARFP